MSITNLLLTGELMGELATTLEDIGNGIGSLFTGMGSPLAVFIILLAVGTGVGYILASVGRRVGAKI
jgi:hypothetical protein